MGCAPSVESRTPTELSFFCDEPLSPLEQASDELGSPFNQFSNPGGGKLRKESLTSACHMKHPLRRTGNQSPQLPKIVLQLPLCVRRDRHVCPYCPSEHLEFDQLFGCEPLVIVPPSRDAIEIHEQMWEGDISTTNSQISLQDMCHWAVRQNVTGTFSQIRLMMLADVERTNRMMCWVKGTRHCLAASKLSTTSTMLPAPPPDLIVRVDSDRMKESRSKPNHDAADQGSSIGMTNSGMVMPEDESSPYSRKPAPECCMPLSRKWDVGGAKYSPGSIGEDDGNLPG